MKIEKVNTLITSVFFDKTEVGLKQLVTLILGYLKCYKHLYLLCVCYIDYLFYIIFVILITVANSSVSAEVSVQPVMSAKVNYKITSHGT